MAAVVASEMFLGRMVDERDIAEPAERDVATCKTKDTSGKPSPVLQKNNLLVFFKTNLYLTAEQL